MLTYLAQTEGASESQQWIAIAVGILGLSYLLLRPRFGKKKRDPLDSAPRASLSQQRSLEREMNNLVVELSEMARQITAQLDTRAARLELLIDEADRRIAELERLRGGGSEHRPSDTVSPPDGPDAPFGGPVASASPADPRHVEVYALADQGLSPHDIAKRLDRPTGEIELILALRSSTTPR